jgi:DegV family protein with EDD domain
MKNVEIFTDSTCSKFPGPDGRHEGVHIIPMAVNWTLPTGTISLTEDKITDEIFNHNSRIVPPSTSAVVYGFEEGFRQTLSEGKDAIAVTVSDKESGVYKYTITAGIAAEKSAGHGKIRVIDSKTTTAALWYLAEWAKIYNARGMSVDNIASGLESQREKVGILTTLTREGLEYLRRGGRGDERVKAFLAKLLNIKPVLGFVDGKITVFRESRTASGAHEFMMEHISAIPDLLKVGVLHTGAEDLAKELVSDISNKVLCPVKNEGFAGYALMSHAGPGAIAIAWETA